MSITFAEALRWLGDLLLEGVLSVLALIARPVLRVVQFVAACAILGLLLDLLAWGSTAPLLDAGLVLACATLRMGAIKARQAI